MIRTKSTFLALIAVLLSPMAANAVPITLQWTDSVSSATGAIPSLGVAPGDSLVFSITVDNGGTSALSQTWSAADFVSASIDVAGGTYVASTFTGPSFASGDFVSDAFGMIVASPIWTTSALGNPGIDNFGTADVRWWINGNNEVWCMEPNASPDFRCILATDVGSNLDPSRWIVADTTPVPEPGTLALLGLGLVGIGLTRRKKKV